MLIEMKERINLFLTKEERKIFDAYCKQTGRSMSDVVRELIRTLESRLKPS